MKQKKYKISKQKLREINTKYEAKNKREKKYVCGCGIAWYKKYNKERHEKTKKSNKFHKLMKKIIETMIL